MTVADFTVQDFAARMDRAAGQAVEAGLTGVLITPGPDLVYFTGYEPTAITERLTLLVAQSGRAPAMILPILERPDAEAAPGVAAVDLTDWTDGMDPYAQTAPLLDPDGRYAISDSAWAMHVLGLQAALPRTGYVSMTAALPMLRAVKDADEIECLTAAGAAAGAAPRGIRQGRFARPTGNQGAPRPPALPPGPGHSPVDLT